MVLQLSGSARLAKLYRVWHSWTTDTLSDNLINNGAPMFFSIEGRPTEALFFATDAGLTLTIGINGDVEEASEEDLSQLRWSAISLPQMNEDARMAIEMARSHASDNGWVLDDLVYYN